MSKENKRPSQREIYGIRAACGLAFVLSVVSLCASLPRSDLSFDYLGLVTGIIALCTTLVIGYQIYNAIELKSRMDALSGDYEKKVQDLKEQIAQAQDEAKEFTRKYHDLMEHLDKGVEYKVSGNNPKAFDEYAKAFLIANELKEETHASYLLKRLKSIFQQGNIDPYMVSVFDLACALRKTDGDFSRRLFDFFGKNRPGDTK